MDTFKWSGLPRICFQANHRGEPRTVTAPSPSTDSYDHPDEARMAAFRRVYENHLVVEDIYPMFARRFQAEGTTRFAELGGGRGPISALLAAGAVTTCVFDLDDRMLAETHPPAVKADLRDLPAADHTFDGAAAVNCLYFLDDPRIGLLEAKRILRPGGLFLASSPGRYNDPE